MKVIALEPLPYTADSRDWFLRVRPLGNAIWLDSAFPHSQRGRFDIISAAPLLQLEGAGGTDMFARVQAALDATLDATIAPIPAELPFQGGALGWFGYEVGRQLEGLPCRAPQAGNGTRFPDAWVGLYSWAIISDHAARRCWLLRRPETPSALRDDIRKRLQGIFATPGAFTLTAPWRDDFPHADYARAFARLQHYIHAGDCYQVNLARRFYSSYTGDAFAAYLHLREIAGAPFSAFVEHERHGAILSLSPERFLAADQHQLFTQPIKGTIARATDPDLDARRGAALLASEKNRAENLMIVDLLRNDLGRSCEPGSIQVEQLFELQSFATVHHLVSSIRGTLRAGLHPLDALRHCFPGGSITGAPKHRAMQIIDELEPHARSIFCGAIGYVSLCGRMDTNISIRTLLAQNGELLAWAGGGIVADSDCDEEFEETRSKIEPLLCALVTPT